MDILSDLDANHVLSGVYHNFMVYFYALMNIYAKKDDKVVFNGRYDVLPKEKHDLFQIGQIFTIAEDVDPGDSWTFVYLKEVQNFMGFNSVAFEDYQPKVDNVITFPSVKRLPENSFKPNDFIDDLLWRLIWVFFRR